MREVEWLTSDDPTEMYSQILQRLPISRRRADLFCVACVRLVLPLIKDRKVKRGFRWLEEHPGQRYTPDPTGRTREAYDEYTRVLRDAHHWRHSGVIGAAINVARDLWAERYDYAFPNVLQLVTDYPAALREEPRTYLSTVIRDIIGNPFRPAAFDAAWRTSTAMQLAQGMYDSRDFAAMPILADALQDAGCENDDILAHCRGPGPHVRGCWVVDLVLGKE